MPLNSYTVISYSEDETALVARKLASKLCLGDVVLLRGDLGAGKSVFARALIQALCGEETIVPSPTFTLVQTYKASEFTLWHFDLYRLNSPEEVYELGIEEALRRGVCLIEWPDRLGVHLPEVYREIELQYGSQPHERFITIKE